MLWAALLLPPHPDDSPPSNDALAGLATWALQFSPRVAVVDEAVVVELESSTRLFGGKRALRDRVFQESRDLGVVRLAWCSNSLAALALARAGIENGFKRPLPEMLDGLPVGVLSAVRPHGTVLAQLGCQVLGDLRKLPRGGLARRFDRNLLAALDEAYELVPQAHRWVTVPETFRGKLELMFRVELAPALLAGARRLLLQLCGWLAARQCGVTAYTLRWLHDAMRPRSAGEDGAITVRTAQPTREIEHLCRLLAEALAKTELLAPVGDLELTADEVQPLEQKSLSLVPDAVNKAESLGLVLERIAARLGPARVLRPKVVEDHRLEWMQHWQPASAPVAKKLPRTVRTPQPTFVLREPLRLATRGPRPMYQGVLLLLTGPHRLEGGWWHRVSDDAGQRGLNVQRDYWLALSEHAGVLWIFQERLAGDEKSAAWYLHGTFA